MTERRSPVATIAGIAFAALIVATFAAFFITQRLKREPGALGQVRATPFFSPNQDGRFDRARIGFDYVWAVGEPPSASSPCREW